MPLWFIVLLLSSPAAHAGKLAITFIGNEAFHITDGQTTLLTDFPYRSGVYGYMAYKMEDVPPIKDGLALITHFHADHWDKELFEKMDLTIIAPPGVLDTLQTPKKIPMAKTMKFKDLTIQSYETPHKMSPQHYSYLVTWHGKKLYFVGDTETPTYLLDHDDLDVAFMTPWLIRTLERQNLDVGAKQVVVYHQKVNEEIPPYMDYRRMKQGEKFEIEFEEARDGSPVKP